MQTALQYAGSTYSQIVAADRRYQSPYATVDAAAGVHRGNYGLELYGQNITDRRAQLFVNSWDDIPRVTTDRPATFGLRVSFNFK